MGFARFMASPVGRLIRIVAGAMLVVLSLLLVGPVGWIPMIIGLVAIAAGAGNFCLLAPLMGAPFKGSDARR